MTVTELVHKLIALPEDQHHKQVVFFDGDRLTFCAVSDVKLLMSGDIEIVGKSA